MSDNFNLDDFKLNDNELDEIAGGVSESDKLSLVELRTKFLKDYPFDGRKKFVSYVATNYGLPALCLREIPLTYNQTEIVLNKLNLL